MHLSLVPSFLSSFLPSLLRYYLSFPSFLVPQLDKLFYAYKLSLSLVFPPTQVVVHITLLHYLPSALVPFSPFLPLSLRGKSGRCQPSQFVSFPSKRGAHWVSRKAALFCLQRGNEIILLVGSPEPPYLPPTQRTRSPSYWYEGVMAVRERRNDKIWDEEKRCEGGRMSCVVKDMI